MQKLIYYAPASFGGLFNYAQEQADALAGEGISVTLLCSPEFKKRPTDRYSIKPNLTEHRTSTSKNKISRALNFLRIVVSNMAVLRREIEDGGFRHVMFVSFAEYFAPHSRERNLEEVPRAPPSLSVDAARPCRCGATTTRGA